MMGGSFMLIFGLLFMLLLIGLPVLLIVAIVTGVWGLTSRRNQQISQLPAQGATSVPPASFTRKCAHCGQDLQANWTHCPNCGAPTKPEG